jgi:RHS repeat-associated protein
MASFYRYDQMNRLKKVQSFDHSNHQGTAWDAYTADDRYQMQLTYDMNGNILTLKRNGNDANNLKMDDFNYNYYALNSSNSPIDIQLTGYNGNSTNLVTNRLSKLEEDINLVANYDADIDGLSTNGNVNYSYDALGNLTQDLSEEIEEIKWNAYGKVVEVLRTSTCQDKPDLVYVYDAFGQRIKKIVKKRTAGVLSHEKDWQETYYVRDAQGNVIAMYSLTSVFYPAYNFVSESIHLDEWDLYGTSRLGTRKQDKNFDPVLLASRNYEWINNTVSGEYILPLQSIDPRKYRILGAKTFELTNHLGNVITTISDRKLMVQDATNTGFVHHYTPEILSIGEQYAFGMNMPGRTYSVENYKYGFNGKENQDELLGEANGQDFGARMYDARVARWWGLDEKLSKKASFSPFLFGANNPIIFVDPDGKAEYWSKDGYWLGTDGENDMINIVITDDELARTIKEASQRGEYANTYYPEQQTFLLPETEILKEIQSVWNKEQDYEGIAEFWTIFDFDDNHNLYVKERGRGKDYSNKIETPPGYASIHSHRSRVDGKYSRRVDDFSDNTADKHAQMFYEVYIVVGLEGKTDSNIIAQDQGRDRRPLKASIRKDDKHLYVDLDVINSIAKGPRGNTFTTFQNLNMGKIQERCPAYD